MITLDSVSLESTVVATPDQVSSKLGGEVVILNLKAGVYHGLDATGARIWELIQEPRTVAEVRDTLLKEYDVEPDRCERDLLELIANMAAAGLVEVQHKPCA